MLELKRGRTYRAKKPRPVSSGCAVLVNDRTVMFVGATEIQYDGPAVKPGRHYPKVSKAAFLAWAERDVTAELPAGEYAQWPPVKREALP